MFLLLFNNNNLCLPPLAALPFSYNHSNLELLPAAALLPSCNNPALPPEAPLLRASTLISAAILVRPLKEASYVGPHRARSHRSPACASCEGHFNDGKFKDNPSDLNAARQALDSYLQAAGSYKNAKSRKLLARILWLLSLDDARGSIAMGFDDFKGEPPMWYWITYIPQLLTGLGHKEAPSVYQILLSIAKSYPQALYFQLRTNREDMLVIKKNQEAKEKARQRQQFMTDIKAGASPSVVIGPTIRSLGSSSSSDMTALSDTRSRKDVTAKFGVGGGGVVLRLDRVKSSAQQTLGKSDNLIEGLANLV
ncbi:hypothetical protein MY3296_010155 [Beauveria thailandica]